MASDACRWLRKSAVIDQELPGHWGVRKVHLERFALPCAGRRECGPAPFISDWSWRLIRKPSPELAPLPPQADKPGLFSPPWILSNRGKSRLQVGGCFWQRHRPQEAWELLCRPGFPSWAKAQPEKLREILSESSSIRNNFVLLSLLGLPSYFPRDIIHASWLEIHVNRPTSIFIPFSESGSP